MTHMRTQIRAALVARLTGLSTTGTHVHASRLRPLTDSELPALLISSEGEEYDDGAYLKNNRPVIRPLRVRLDIFVKAVSGYEDTADAALADIETALFDTVAHNTLDGLVMSTTLASILDPEMDDSTDKPVVRLPVILRVNYS